MGLTHPGRPSLAAFSLSSSSTRLQAARWKATNATAMPMAFQASPEPSRHATVTPWTPRIHSTPRETSLLSPLARFLHQPSATAEHDIVPAWPTAVPRHAALSFLLYDVHFVIVQRIVSLIAFKSPESSFSRRRTRKLSQTNFSAVKAPPTSL